VNLRDVETPPIIGIDPGSRWVGLCVCVGAEVLDAVTLWRPDRPTVGSLPNHPGNRAWIGQVISTVLALQRRHETAAAGWPDAPGGGRWYTACESYHRPSTHLGGRRQTGGDGEGMRAVPWETSLTQALVWAVAYVAFPRTVVVAPGGNGERHLLETKRRDRSSSGAVRARAEEFYPRELCGARPAGWFVPQVMPPQGQRRDGRRNERSAFDVAKLAALAIDARKTRTAG
jgi:hypothetical protein